ncbi:MAG: long-chain fatty acid--CoA ligase [Candidatus Rokubacteria bacterium 13_1_40CM_69_27]|nr:MAG: long-chain fatty acid--CoA ligase [Candidatus Rokubacteria bacterium 13_1_40CM_69_27]OLC39415.1 MAG: long-chain fatty acid--CoA ligase [Candidatus Rokubacteria bacterium 13_1_40CM_4_69_5]
MSAPQDDLIMHYPLTITHFFERTRKLFPKKTLGTRVPGVGLLKSTYADFADRTARLAGALRSLGVKKGDRVGTFAWNSHRHLEVYFAAPMMGAVLHTVNIRLSAPDITYIVNHAADRVLIADASCWPTLEPLRRQLPSVEHVVVMKDTPDAQIPPGALDYEELLRSATPVTAWPRLEETDAAGMCYTSGTTGNPKGAVYTHRAIFLHSMASSMTDVLGISERDVILHIVPMFHANAWCVPFAGVMNGATQFFGGPNPQPRDIVEIVHNERVTFVGAVPTVWIAIDAILEAEPGRDVSSIRAIPIGGSAAPRTLLEKFDKKYGAPMLHAWGMTEMTPLGTICRLKSYMETLPDEERYAIRAKQGYPTVCVDLRIVDDEGREQPWDGQSMGEMQVRGPWVIRSYYNNPDSADRFTPDGWFRTGDVATLDPEGYVQITDRTKDLIKSGGEWISSIDVETLIMGHPKVLEAAVIAVPHPRWVERPLACVVPKPGAELAPAEILDYLRPKLAKWALPDAVVLIDAVPKTSVGKFDKKALRERFKGWTPTLP